MVTMERVGNCGEQGSLCCRLTSSDKLAGLTPTLPHPEDWDSCFLASGPHQWLISHEHHRTDSLSLKNTAFVCFLKDFSVSNSQKPAGTKMSRNKEKIAMFQGTLNNALETRGLH